MRIYANNFTNFLQHHPPNLTHPNIMSAQQDQALRDTVNKTLLKFLDGYVDASKDYDPSLVSLVSATLYSKLYQPHRCSSLAPSLGCESRSGNRSAAA